MPISLINASTYRLLQPTGLSENGYILEFEKRDPPTRLKCKYRR